jgi:thiamine-phosphate pyrophosphorylase
MSDCKLYLISPEGFEVNTFSVQLLDAFRGGKVASFQLRLKSASEDEFIKIAQKLKVMCHENDVAFIINDSPKIALEVGADGVHLGQEDLGIEEARTLLGHNAIIGVTCHDSKHLAFEAGEAGADYVAFGAFFPTETKKVSHHATLEVLSDWAGVVEIPCVAIGGITVDNCPSLIEAGADFLAVSSGVWAHPKGAEAAVKEFNQILGEG